MNVKNWLRRGAAAFMALTLSVGLLPAGAAAQESLAVQDASPAVQAEWDGLSFDNGASSLKHYAVAGSALDIPETVELRVRLDEGEDRRQVIIGTYTDGADCTWGIEVNADNTLRYFEEVLVDGKKQRIDCKFDDEGSEINVCTGEWMLLSLVRDQENQQVLAYVDGEYMGSLKGQYPFHETQMSNPLHFGTDLRHIYGLKGEIAEVRLWDDVRTPEEIKGAAAQAVTGSEEGLAHAWRLTQPEAESPEETVFADLVSGGVEVTTQGYQYVAPEPDPNERDGLRFDMDDNEYVQVQGAVEIPDTVEAWVKLDSGTNARQIIMNNYGRGGSTWGIEVNANNTLRYWESGPASINLYFNDIPVCTDQWMLISVVRDKENGEVKAYINGELKGQQSIGDDSFADVELENFLCFGGDYHPTPINLNGSIHEVRMWGDARTAEEIAQYYTQAVTGSEEGLEHLWNFSQAVEGQVFQDTVFPDGVQGGFDVVAVGYPLDPNQEYPVTFELNGGSVAGGIPAQSGKLGEKVARPEQIPEREYAQFTGWYQDASCTRLWDFDTDTIQGPTTIYAGYEVTLPQLDLKVEEGISFVDASDQICAAERLSDVPRTFEATIRLPKAPSPSGGVICGNWMDAGYYDYDLGYVNFEITADGQPRLYWQQERRAQPNDGQQDVVIPGIDLRSDEWVHVAVTFDDEADLVRGYVNGVLVSTIEGCTFQPVVPAQALKIGGDYRGTGGQVTDSGYNSKYFRGEIANVSIWSSVRSGEEIAADVRALTDSGTVSTQGEGLLAAWSFDDPDAPLYRDLSENHNDAAEFVDWLYPDFAQGDYTMIALPDTQFMSQDHPESYLKLTEWIADHEQAYNIQAVMHLGDMVNSNYQNQWDACTDAMDVLNDTSIAWMPMRGNHDDSAAFNREFPYAAYGENRTWFVDSFEEGKLDQSCWQVSAGGREYLILSMGYAPSTEAIAWAEELIAANPDKNVILTAHSFMYWDGTHHDPGDLDSPALPNSGENMWQQLGAKYPNVVLGLGGHIGYPDLASRVDLNGAGREVTSILCDAQGIDATYDLAMLMMLTFHEDSNEVDVNWYSVCEDRLFRTRNQFTIQLPHVGEEYPETKEITAVAALEDMTAYAGTPVSELGLPGTVEVTLSDGSKAACPVTWSSETYQQDRPGNYTFVGQLIPGEGMGNPDGLTAQVMVSVLAYIGGGDHTSSGGSSSGNTQVTQNPDGSTTTTVTRPDGSRTATTKAADGSVSVVRTGADGSVEGEVTLSAAALKDAEIPLLPMPALPAADEAARLTVNLPEGAGARRVEIPVEGVTSGTVAVLVERDGTERVMKDTLTTRNGITALLSDGDTVKIVDNSKPFEDVDRDYWGKPFIDFVTSRALFAGNSPSTFAPDAAMTRAMIVTVLAAWDGAQTGAEGDVWYAAAQKWAMERGISDGSDMEGALTREQLAVMLWSYAGRPAASGSLSAFADGDSASPWAQQALVWAVEQGLLSGSDNKALLPQSQATRIQVAVMMSRFVELMA